MASAEFIYPKWDYRILFLRKIHKRNRNVLEELSDSAYSRKLGDLNIAVSGLISDDFLRISTFEESVGMMMTIPKLKEYLKQKGAKCGGKKDELVVRAIELFSPEEKSVIEEIGRFYLITPKGWVLIEEDDNRFKLELDRYQKSLIEPMAKSDFDIVFREISAFYSTYQFPVGLESTGEDCISNHVKNVAIELMRSNYLTGSMKLERELEQKIRAIACLSYLFRFGIADFDLVGNMIAVWKDFSCKEIENFLRGKPTGIFENDDPESQSEVINIFYHAIWMEATNSIELKKITESNIKNRYAGIEILSGNNLCGICKGLDTYYRWDEINRLPKLPKYPGCTCMYTFWEK